MNTPPPVPPKTHEDDAAGGDEDVFPPPPLSPTQSTDRPDLLVSEMDLSNYPAAAPPQPPRKSDSLSRTLTGTATLMYSPWDDMYVGFEYFYGERKNFDGQTGYDNRLNFVLRYFFNR